jgi:hypothetical protein
MAETAALLADEILPERPLRQWVLSLPMALRFLLATRFAVLSAVLGVVYRTISGHLLGEARLMRRAAGVPCGAAAADAPDEVSRGVRDRDRDLRPLPGKAAVTLSGGASALDPETDPRRGSGSWHRYRRAAAQWTSAVRRRR